MAWTIKQAAKITGLSADTLRYYDKEGIVSPKRHENGYRYYDETDISYLKNIVVMKYAHFTLADMKNMENLFHQEPNPDCCEISKQVLTAKIENLNQAIYNYQKIVGLMEELLIMVDSDVTSQCNKEKINDFINQIFIHIRK